MERRVSSVFSLIYYINYSDIRKNKLSYSVNRAPSPGFVWVGVTEEDKLLINTFIHSFIHSDYFF